MFPKQDCGIVIVVVNRYPKGIKERMSAREQLEKNQALLYALALTLAAGTGLLWPEFSSRLDRGFLSY